MGEPLIPHRQLPPCMMRILERLRDGQNVPHEGRRSFAAFAMQLGVQPDDVATAFVNTPNYDPAKTKSQIASLAGHMPSSCQNMQAAGLCPTELRQALCDHIRNPISFAKARQRTYEPARVAAPARHVGPLTVAKCPCGWRSRILPGPLAAQVAAAAHAGPFDEEEVLKHIDIEYLEADAL